MQGSPARLVRRPGPPFCAKGGAKGGVRLFAYPLSRSAPRLRASLLRREGAPLRVCMPPLRRNEGRRRKGGLPTRSPARVSGCREGGGPAWTHVRVLSRASFARKRAQGVLSRGWRGQMRGQPFPPFALPVRAQTGAGAQRGGLVPRGPRSRPFPRPAQKRVEGARAKGGRFSGAHERG
ncbi:hypothetical protein EDB92DRAFT_1831243 [Lactarius akahatsu]|uniref:Uncharacterized protein n=1 Tax=Lactarius akahatsu TaxID=416441 RepID=A0AAD4LPU2_9AGAM|nr:hypothetical protein EDB92DRAFT_1831243 [Lactarius akahatsu]